MQYEYRGWTLAVLIAVDQFGNAIGGGNPDSTISSRVGHFSAITTRIDSPKKYAYWKTLEWIIDLSFYPVDGASHCYKAWKADAHMRYRRGNDITQFSLSMIIFLLCPVIAMVLWPLAPFIRSWRYK